MSVYKSKRGQSKMKFIDNARELEMFTLKCCLHIPKKYSFLLTNDIMKLASGVSIHVRNANAIYPCSKHEAEIRRDELNRAIMCLENLDPKLQLLYAEIKENPNKKLRKWIIKKMKYWGYLIATEYNLIKATKQADRQRYKDLPDDFADAVRKNEEKLKERNSNKDKQTLNSLVSPEFEAMQKQNAYKKKSYTEVQSEKQKKGCNEKISIGENRLEKTYTDKKQNKVGSIKRNIKKSSN